MKSPLEKLLDKELHDIDNGKSTHSPSPLGDRGVAKQLTLDQWRLIKRTKMHIDVIKAFWGEPPKEFWDSDF